MRFCDQCGARMDDGAVACPNCGAVPVSATSGSSQPVGAVPPSPSLASVPPQASGASYTSLTNAEAGNPSYPPVLSGSSETFGPAAGGLASPNQPVAKVSHSKRNIVIAIVAAVVVVVLALASVLFIRSRSNSGAAHSSDASSAVNTPTKPLSQAQYPAGEWALRAKLKDASWKTLSVNVDEQGDIALLASGVKLFSGKLSKAATNGGNDSVEYTVKNLAVSRPQPHFLGDPFDSYLSDKEIAASDVTIDVPKKGTTGDWYLAIQESNGVQCEFGMTVKDDHKFTMGWSYGWNSTDTDDDEDSDDDYDDDYDDDSEEDDAYLDGDEDGSVEQSSVKQVKDQMPDFDETRTGTWKPVKSDTPGQKAYLVSMDDGGLFDKVSGQHPSDIQYTFEVPSNH
ncbi:zinc ribbon domain-containing protein [Bifidobacterium sp. ESL0800]|uniref:zinc ribbon domain-containing protein n=1 Tax=Bifidobacterium sp. ESL0800 TaxID=2983236 RepID=UPI0023F7C7FB|nr:zinc ribbon domain-containing protein [Bifidobacterium sp. ESL0800]WEV75569.1 zinc ribbon domain-containing protein [Bifidobacterium sp. ESL0800]